MNRLAIFLLGLLTLLACSCSASLESQRALGQKSLGVIAPAPLNERCVALDDRRVTWGAIAKGAAVLGGGAGLATIPVEDKDAQMGLAAGTAAMAAVAAIAIYVQEGADESWARECSQR